MKKKITLVATSVLLVAAMVIGGTLAYFTDTDEAENVFTLGNVSIALHEGAFAKTLANGAPAKEDGTLADRYAPAEKGVYDYLDEEYQAWLDDQIMVPGTQAANRIQKRIFIENDGAYPAYVRVIIGMPKDLDNAGGVSASNILHFNQVTGDINNKLGAWENIQNQKPDYEDENYNYYCIHYTAILPGGECTNAEAVSYFYLDEHVDHNGTNYTYNGNVIESLNDGKINIPVYAEAIQADGFSTYEEAFAAYGAPKFLSTES